MKDQTSKSSKGTKKKHNMAKSIQLETGKESTLSENALVRFLTQTYDNIRSQPEVDSTIRWIKSNPKKSVGIGLGILLLTRSKKATSLAKFAFSTGALGWVYNQSRVQDQPVTHRPVSSERHSPQAHLH